MAAVKTSAPIQGSGKKGGTIFPRINLASAAPLAKKLVSKTHVEPQPASIILPGVFGTGGPQGQIKASALKQYGLLSGKSDAYTATDLARKINSAPPDELPTLYAQACLAPKVFRTLFQTFHGDAVSFAKLKQQAASAGIHPDFQEECANLFAKSAEFASLGKIVGDSLHLLSIAETGGKFDAANSIEIEAPEVITAIGEEPSASVAASEKSNTKAKDAQHVDAGEHLARAVINVNVTLDSSLDTDKLERQLALLRKYGAL